MANPQPGLAYINYAGFKNLDKSERKEIEKIVNLYIEKIKRVSSILGLRLHLKSVHERKVGFPKQEYIHQIDATLETVKGTFYARSRNRNPYVAVADIMKNLFSEIKRKHPHKEEWKEEFKNIRKLKKNPKT